MRKVKFMTMVFLSSLVLISLSQMSVGVSYCGLANGDEKTWTVSMDLAAIPGLPSEATSSEDLFADVSITCTITGAPVEGTDHVLVPCTLAINVGDSALPLSDLDIAGATKLVIVDGEADIATVMSSVMGSMGADVLIPALAVATNMDWDAIATLVTGLGTTAAALSNGIKVTEDLEGDELTVEVTYDEKGFLDAIVAKVNGVEVFSLSSEGGIPGFGLVALLGITGIATLGIIYFVKRKKLRIVY